LTCSVPVAQRGAPHGPFHHLGIAAGVQALKDSGPATEAKHRIGVTLARHRRAAEIERRITTCSRAARHRFRRSHSSTIINMISNLLIMHGLKGPNLAW